MILGVKLRRPLPSRGGVRTRPTEAPVAPTCSAHRSRLRPVLPTRPWRAARLALWSVLATLSTSLLACGGAVNNQARPRELPGEIGVQPSFEYLPEYRIRVGDRMRIEFLSDPEPASSASKVVVRPDGRISLRGVDDVLAAGLTPAQLDSVLTTSFGRLLVDPELSVIVETFSREKVYMLGQLNNPRAVDLQGPMSLLQAISAAGGFKLGANRNDVVIVRRREDGTIGAFKFDTEPLMEAKEGARDIPLLAQDVVIVPKTTVTKVGEFVQQYVTDLDDVVFTIFLLNDISGN